ncbi:hypothetical protein [Tenacibaculum maritimum]|uniref:hypothetical protein n=1 Tax=Tenacibaculum maritimum TaxID=107401 RepID=UPI0012E5622D|nr:hypothetical protein [Tenacibaculum maritimum]CAA0214801.1 conserved hypothetical protein [Tenacibaculum maritimum]CAA0250718.1 conserved hypothetical protein [Tenacibaculum maritimum]
MNYLSNREGALRALTFFQERHAEKPVFSAGDEIKPFPSELYVNKEITVGGGLVPLLTGGTDSEIGITNFDGNKLEDGRAFAIDGISFKVGKAKIGTLPYNVDYATGLTKEEKKAFQFADVVVKQNNEVLVRMSVSAIENGAPLTSEYRDLALALIRPKTKVEFGIEFPSGVEAPNLADGNGVFVSAVLRGFESYQRR